MYGHKIKLNFTLSCSCVPSIIIHWTKNCIAWPIHMYNNANKVSVHEMAVEKQVQ